MELLETQDPEKRRLIETSDRHKRELQKEVKSVSDRTERILTNALIIGGSLALTYFIVSQLGGWKTKKKKAKGKKEETVEGEAEDDSALVAPSFISQIGSKVINQATLILLDIAREKLSEYLESRKNRDENS